ncbi:ComF family protein [Chitinophagaceae bacterium LB-8]|uniref:ComF family protein n=1 Tax=Paraflavisolibacter caeni TaxID=2982496 RepID=A0A9X3B944_9BACT|nr:ComF family protein [Paraflavisolibacter caeni]MCU7551630.1 ComF family protein [Paraflavisolibacter caeni]
MLLHTKTLLEALLHLIFPHLCAGCRSDLLNRDHQLCLECISSLPETSFHLHADNPVERIFWGRIPVTVATAQYYFTKESMMQHLVHQLKYKGNKELGFYLGTLMAQCLAETNRFAGIDALVPMPLHPSRERKRGYNQATVLCEGIASILQVPVLQQIIIRNHHTETQTHKSRIERWQNMEGSFTLTNEASIEGKHILLVDDVITTGATVEACAAELLKAKNLRLSIAALCITHK